MAPIFAAMEAGDLRHRQEAGEAHGEADEEHRLAVDQNGLTQRIVDGGGGQLLVNEDADDQGVNDTDNSGLGRGEDTGIDTAEDDDGDHQGEPGLLEGLAELAEGEVLVGLILHAVAILCDGDVVDDHQHDADQDTGKNTGLEHISDGAVSNNAVDNERDAGGNDDADGTGGSVQRGGVSAVIAFLFHLGDGQGADGADGRGGGTGQGGEEHGGDDRDHTERALDVADERVGKLEDLIR